MFQQSTQHISAYYVVHWDARKTRPKAQGHFGCAVAIVGEHAVVLATSRMAGAIQHEAVEELRRLSQRHGLNLAYRQGARCNAVRPRRRRLQGEPLRAAREHYGDEQLRVSEREELPQLIASSRYLAALHNAGKAWSSLRDWH